MRVGFGFDVHRLKESGNLYLGGVQVSSDIGVVAHSDGDVIIHSLVDALLGATGLGDIGEFFPDSDEKYKNKESSFFLKEVMRMLKENGIRIVNVDITIALDKIKILPFKRQIIERISRLLGIDDRCVSVKAKTTEGLVSDAVMCWCVCLVENV